jgi:hypothetical protein
MAYGQKHGLETPDIDMGHKKQAYNAHERPMQLEQKEK